MRGNCSDFSEKSSLALAPAKVLAGSISMLFSKGWCYPDNRGVNG